MAKAPEVYAKAIFKLAKKQNVLQSVSEDFDDFLTMVRESSPLRSFLLNPLYSKTTAAHVLETLGQQAKFSPITINFLKLMGLGSRASKILEAIKTFKKLYKDEQGVIEADVISAEALEKAHLKSLKDVLTEYTHKNVDLLHEIDQSLLGGFVIRMGSKVVDFSLKTKLEKLKRNLES